MKTRFSLINTLSLLLLFAPAGQRALAEQLPQTEVGTNNFAVQFGKKLLLHSRLLKEDRPYWVYLPESYQSSNYTPKRYPVLYLLDGDSHFQWAAGVVRFMSIGWNLNIQIPELIIVAIPNTGTNRDRDFTPEQVQEVIEKTVSAPVPGGGSEYFRRFLAEELIPQIETNYRTAPFRILAGHSLGGLFAVDTFLHRPSTFQAYLAMDPNLDWNQGATLRKAQQILTKAGDAREIVYLSRANHHFLKGESLDPGHQACREFVEFLKTNGPPRFRATLQYFEEEDHSSVPLVSLYHGLLFVFDGYKPSLAVVFNPVALKEHFAKVSERFGFQILPPQQLVDSFGYYMLHGEHNPDRALEAFKLNAANFPESPASYIALGEACAAKGEKDSAIQNFEKVLTLNPEDKHAKKRLEDLRRAKP